MQRKSLLTAALAGSLLGLAGFAQATPAVVYSGNVAYGQPGVVVSVAPPAPIYEAAPAPRAGYVWSPGHYVWNNGAYVWRTGEWLPSRPGYAWQAPHWQQRVDGTWYLASGAWVPSVSRADRDGDGIRNRYDADKDGDGVANWNDRRPNNYYR